MLEMKLYQLPNQQERLYTIKRVKLSKVGKQLRLVIPRDFIKKHFSINADYILLSIVLDHTTNYIYGKCLKEADEAEYLYNVNTTHYIVTLYNGAQTTVTIPTRNMLLTEAKVNGIFIDITSENTPPTFMLELEVTQ